MICESVGHYRILEKIGQGGSAFDVEVANHAGDPGIAGDIASNYAVAGDKARALDWLEKAYEERNPSRPYSSCTPLWDPLRSDPRFRDLLRRMKLP